MAMENPAEYPCSTIQCLLCRGLVIYKNGDLTRFTAHLANEHGTFFDVEYLLASCFMDEDQKTAISSSIRSSFPYTSPTEEQGYQDDVFDVPEQPAWPTTTDDPQYLIQPTEDAMGAEKNIIEKNKIKMEPAETSKKSNLSDVLASDGIDLELSAYFKSRKDGLIGIAKDLPAFNESLTCLPGWKWKAVKHISRGQETNIKHYLTPNSGVKITTSLGVIEYLRLQGREFKELLDICNMMKIGTKKLSKLYSADAWKTKIESGILKQIENKEIKMEPEENKIGGRGEVEDSFLDESTVDMRDEEANPETVESFSPKSISSPSQTKSSDNSAADILASSGIDVKKSLYFSNSSVLAIVQSAGKESTFTESLSFLPGWKCRNAGKGKHYLIPNTRVRISTSLGIIEYLRLTGCQLKELVEICNSLRIGSKKMKKLYSDEEWKSISESGVLAQLKKKNGDIESDGNGEAVVENVYGDITEPEETADDSFREHVPSENHVEESMETEEPFTQPSAEPVSQEKNDGDNLLSGILRSSGVDLKKSLYFRSTKKSLSLVQSSSATAFTETLSFLPGWKFKETKVTVKGKETTMKRYLAPNNRVKIDSSLGVLEWLRLEGRDTKELVSISNLFRIGSKKLKKLYSEDEWKTLSGTGVLSNLNKRERGGKVAVGSMDVKSSANDELSDQEENRMELDQSPVESWNDEGNLQVDLSEESITENSLESSLYALEEKLDDFHREMKMDSDQQTEKMMLELSKDIEELDQDITTEEASAKDENVDQSSSDLDLHSEIKKGTLQSGGFTSNNAAIVKMMTEQGIDINKSNYFTTTKSAAFDGTKIANHFIDAMPYLPEGWKTKKTEVKNNGKVIVQKQYLSPNNIMFKATLGVVEFLRLEGKLNPTEILEVAKSLKVGEKKLKRLFNNEPIANTTIEA